MATTDDSRKADKEITKKDIIRDRIKLIQRILMFINVIAVLICISFLINRVTICIYK